MRSPRTAHAGPLGTRERVAFEVLYGTGLRRGDAVRVGRPHLRGGVIRIKTEKTGENVSIAVEEDLTRALEAGPVGDLTFIVGVNGRPRVKEAFGEWFRAACRAAEVTGKSAHGIRKAAATADAEAGWSDAELGAKYAWRDRKMPAHYTQSANREKLSLAASKRTKTETSPPALKVLSPAPEKKTKLIQYVGMAKKRTGGPGGSRNFVENQNVRYKVRAKSRL